MQEVNPPSVDRPVVSIVIGTYARLEHLKRCIAGIRANVGIAHETIVVGSGGGDAQPAGRMDGHPAGVDDGLEVGHAHEGGQEVRRSAAGDGTEAWLAEQADVRFIREFRREGACLAYNKGFLAARGQYVMWLNDDSYPLAGAVEAAVRTIERPDLADVGMVAFYHNMDRAWNKLDTIEYAGLPYSIYNVRGYPYANFGLLRRELLERLDYLDERYYFCAWDPDLSLKVQKEAGMLVVGCRQALVYHEELIDERKSADMSIIDEDNGKLFAKWDLPAKFSYPDPIPGYRKLMEQRGLL